MSAPDPELDAALREAFPSVFPDEWPADEPPIVPAAQHVALAAFLQRQGFTLYITVVATHFLAADDAPEHHEVATVLRRPIQPSTLFSWRVRLEGEPVLPSLVHLYAGADFQEREQFDLVGVQFSHHPDLRRLMMPEDWPGHPLRKDYAIDTSHAPWR